MSIDWINSPADEVLAKSIAKYDVGVAPREIEDTVLDSPAPCREQDCESSLQVVRLTSGVYRIVHVEPKAYEKYPESDWVGEPTRQSPWPCPHCRQGMYQRCDWLQHTERVVHRSYIEDVAEYMQQRPGTTKADIDGFDSPDAIEGKIVDVLHTYPFETPFTGDVFECVLHNSLDAEKVDVLTDAGYQVWIISFGDIDLDKPFLAEISPYTPD